MSVVNMMLFCAYIVVFPQPRVFVTSACHYRFDDRWSISSLVAEPEH